MNILQYFLAALLIGVVILNLTQRKHLSHGERKRFATLYLAGLALVLYLTALLIKRYRVTPWLLLIVLAADTVVIIWQRNHFPFKRKCIACGEPLTLKRILYFDSNLCESCDSGDVKDSPEHEQ